MKIRPVLFNFYLLLVLGLVCGGCRTTDGKAKKEKKVSTLQLYLETNPNPTGKLLEAAVYRAAPILMYVEPQPFLDTANVLWASVTPAMGGFSIKIQFDAHGTLVLDNITTANRGRQYAVLGQFGETRWLAAPLITQRISNGLLVFTPDASKEEAERFVLGLNTVAEELQKKSKF